jgi:CBS-domain-containing membrane protein/PII-like signaling protein
MNIVGMGRRVRIYTGESTQWERKPLFLALLEFLRAEGAAGATVLRGVAGFGANSRIHTATILRLSEDLPMVIDWVDAPERVERLLPRICEMVADGLVTVEEVQVAKYSHRPVRADVPEHLRVADVMNRDVVRVQPETSLKDLVGLLIGRDYRAVPVVDEAERVVGIITNGDLVERGGLAMPLDLLATASREAIQRELAALAASGRTATEVMTREVVTALADMSVLDAARLMAQRKLKRLPIVDPTGHLLGIVSRVDLLRTVAQGYPAPEAGLSQERPARLVADVMHRQVPTVSLHGSLPEVIDAIVSTRLNRAVVVDVRQRVVGIVTDAELVRRLGERPGIVTSLMRRAAAVPIADHVKVADLMIADVVTTRPDVEIEVAIREMLARKFKILPVVDEQGRLIGIVDRFDLLQAIAGFSEQDLSST